MSTSMTVIVDEHTELTASVWEPAPPADGAPILALHPGIGDRRIWGSCAPAWAAAGHRVVAFDRRGFGDTTYGEGVHDELEDVLAVAHATGIDQAPLVVVGSSSGGRLALDFALAHPERVSALVLIAPSVSGYPSERWEESPTEAALDAQIEVAEAAGDQDEINRLEVRYWLDGTDQPEGRVGGAARDLLTAMNARILAAPSPGSTVDRQPAWSRLDRVTAPALVVLGEHDLPGFARLGAELVAAMPAGRLVNLAGTAHCPMLDRPDELNEVVLGFVRELGG